MFYGEEGDVLEGVDGGVDVRIYRESVDGTTNDASTILSWLPSLVHHGFMGGFFFI